MGGFLEDTDLMDVPCRECPMPSRNLLTSDQSSITADEQRWCRTVMGRLNYFVRGTRWDVAHAVSRVSQRNKSPDVGTVKALKVLGGYLKQTVGWRLSCRRERAEDRWDVWTDSDHWGDKDLVRSSRSGLLVRLNGVPVHWRSTVQKANALSPAEAEIYALSEGARDARQVHWVADEMGVTVPSGPLVVHVDNKQVESFCGETCARSKLRGCFDLREQWVEDLRNINILKVKWVDTKENLADFFTKCFVKKDFLSKRASILI